ncbi:uncharacterized protein LOC116852245 [Odontomachus brunneus]|uniref:uncharacterized protein LOC116852245 n=1 Tax=Odontomachus brunneus TaxID=486640 RepID=UPI0013F208EC|nr:uncharacterized protein LOC116852245 [Odontomachus brunneus]
MLGPRWTTRIHIPTTTSRAQGLLRQWGTVRGMLEGWGGYIRPTRGGESSVRPTGAYRLRRIEHVVLHTGIRRRRSASCAPRAALARRLPSRHRQRNKESLGEIGENVVSRQREQTADLGGGRERCIPCRRDEGDGRDLDVFIRNARNRGHDINTSAASSRHPAFVQRYVFSITIPGNCTGNEFHEKFPYKDGRHDVYRENNSLGRQCRARGKSWTFLKTLEELTAPNQEQERKSEQQLEREEQEENEQRDRGKRERSVTTGVMMKVHVFFLRRNTLLPLVPRR